MFCSSQPESLELTHILGYNSLPLVSHKCLPGTLPQQCAGATGAQEAGSPRLWLGILCARSLLISWDCLAMALHTGSPSGVREDCFVEAAGKGQSVLLPWCRSPAQHHCLQPREHCALQAAALRAWRNP